MKASDLDSLSAQEMQQLARRLAYEARPIDLRWVRAQVAQSIADVLLTEFLSCPPAGAGASPAEVATLETGRALAFEAWAAAQTRATFLLIETRLLIERARLEWEP